MLLKIKVGTSFLLNGEPYRVVDTLMSVPNLDEASTHASFVAVDSNGANQIRIEFGEWTVAIDERRLDGLKLLLTRG